MKPHVADWSTKVRCARIVAQDGTTVRITEHPVDLVMSNGQVYRCDTGYEFTGYDDDASMAPGSFDLTGILDHGITRDQLGSGVFDNARIYAFATSWKAPIEDEEPNALAFLGKTTLNDSTYSTEVMSASDVLSQDVGRIYSPQCQWVLFDRHLGPTGDVIIASTRSRCTGPRSDPDGPNIDTFRVTGTITAVTSQYQFQDSGRTEADDWFTAGEVLFTGGQNAGLAPIKIKQSTSGGQFYLHGGTYYMPQIGDTYMMIPGCRLRLSEDCRDKFSNVINFGGQPHVPSTSEYTQVGRGS
ncbi:DUF2163 domain-containing protein [Pseudomonas sp. NY15436]|uniref:DUF2163 domain-containing protein n=1 Tax=Pseudomonas sp. NY15436 TaxID=3400359 RepID=UPI003A8A1409